MTFELHDLWALGAVVSGAFSVWCFCRAAAKPTPEPDEFPLPADSGWRPEMTRRVDPDVLERNNLDGPTLSAPLTPFENAHLIVLPDLFRPGQFRVMPNNTPEGWEAYHKWMAVERFHGTDWDRRARRM